MVQSILNGASGLRAHQTQMDVIGNNIANVNTIGFKAARADFRSMLARTIRAATPETTNTGGTDPMQVGMGVTVGDIRTIQTQGSANFTGRDFDWTIQGKGFFVLSNGAEKVFTRDGSLTVDGKGSLVSSGALGYHVAGWMANATTGAINTAGALENLNLNQVPSTVARGTSTVGYAGNFDAGAAVGSTTSNSHDIYDSLGRPHRLTVTFEKTSAGTWSWTASSPDGTMASGSGDIVFDTNGQISSGGTGSPVLTLTTPDGATADINLKLDFSKLTNLGSTTGSAIATASQDGLPTGSLKGYSISPEGLITAVYSNGMTRDVAQVALADFANPTGLEAVGGNLFAQTVNSGSARIGAANSGGRGQLTSQYLEMSNVDLSVEFTNMIVNQRGFQANSRVVTTSDEMLQDLIQLKR